MLHLRLSFLSCIGIVAVTLSSAEQVVKLSSGYDMPILGLGTWQIKPKDVDKALTAALEDGYRHIDSSPIYENEDAIGKSLKKWFAKGNKREDLFITTKLPPIGNRAADVEKYLNSSLKKLGLDYVDMYLIHTPVGMLSIDPPILDLATDHIATWKLAMEAQVKAGRAKSIGLSNFNETQIENVFSNAEIKPSNLQVKNFFIDKIKSQKKSALINRFSLTCRVHAYNQEKPLRKVCAKHNIAVTGSSPLGSPASSAFTDGKGVLNLMGNPTIRKIAKAHKKTPAQVLLRFSVQNGIIVIPKSSHPNRIKENHDVFDFQLTEDEMKQISGLDKGEEGRIFNFAVLKGIKNHPQYPWLSQIKKS